jgi:hypothetical protein
VLRPSPSTLSELFRPDRPVDALVVMLWCAGFRGEVQFWNIAVRIHLLPPTTAQSELAYCLPAPPNATSPSPFLSSVSTDVLMRGHTDPAFHVTLVTQASIDRLSPLASIATTWQGPLSVAIYVPCCSHRASRVWLSPFLFFDYVV